MNVIGAEKILFFGKEIRVIFDAFHISSGDVIINGIETIKRKILKRDIKRISPIQRIFCLNQFLNP